jgi:Ca-activated chloride channel family protein
MIKENILTSIVTLLLLVPLAFLGCSGGSGSDGTTEPTGSPSIQVLPAAYDFGTVTDVNAPAPLEVEIINRGTAGLNVSSIVLLDTVNFSLNLSGGSKPCTIASPVIAAGGNCTVEVDFHPQSTDSFSSILRIRSNDSTNPMLDLSLSGKQEPVNTLNVRINQVEPCPGPEVTAYVSVTDQGGYPVTGLTAADFTITEAGGYTGPPNAPILYVANNATLSVALVLDYSGSITDVQDNVDDMEESAAGFVDQLGAGDEAEIIKFADDFDVVQSWQPGSDSGINILKTAIYASYDNGRETDLYDAVVQAVADVALRSKQRRAVIVITDGENDGFLTNLDLADVITDAQEKGVPIFTVGLGQDLNPDILRQMADDTGGHYYESATSDNLRTIYRQLSDVLFQDSYILTYTSGLGAGITTDLTIGATSGTITGNNTKEFTSCP